MDFFFLLKNFVIFSLAPLEKIFRSATDPYLLPSPSPKTQNSDHLSSHISQMLSSPSPKISNLAISFKLLDLVLIFKIGINMLYSAEDQVDFVLHHCFYCSFICLGWLKNSDHKQNPMKSMSFKKQFSPPKKYRKKENKFWEKQF